MTRQAQHRGSAETTRVGAAGRAGVRVRVNLNPDSVNTNTLSYTRRHRRKRSRPAALVFGRWDSTRAVLWIFKDPSTRNTGESFPKVLFL